MRAHSEPNQRRARRQRGARLASGRQAFSCTGQVRDINYDLAPLLGHARALGRPRAWRIEPWRIEHCAGFGGRCVRARVRLCVRPSGSPVDRGRTAPPTTTPPAPNSPAPLVSELGRRWLRRRRLRVRPPVRLCVRVRAPANCVARASWLCAPGWPEVRTAASKAAAAEVVKQRLCQQRQKASKQQQQQPACNAKQAAEKAIE